MQTITLEVSHIDTCLSCYLQDHHNREGECLIGIPVDGSSTYASVMQALEEEMLADDRIPIVPDAVITEAVQAMAEGVADMDALFDDGLEVPDDGADAEFGEGPQAWFLVKWESE